MGQIGLSLRVDKKITVETILIFDEHVWSWRLCNKFYGFDCG